MRNEKLLTSSYYIELKACIDMKLRADQSGRKSLDMSLNFSLNLGPKNSTSQGYDKQ